MCSRNSTLRGAQSFKQNQNVAILPIISTILNSKKTFPPTTKTKIQHIPRGKNFMFSFLSTLPFIFVLSCFHSIIQTNVAHKENKTKQQPSISQKLCF
jgi:hypothetical protein